jgi:hypothetical protein
MIGTPDGMHGEERFIEEDAALAALVGRCRRRAGLVLFVRSSSAACAVTIAIVTATRFVGLGDGRGLMWVLSAVATGVATGAAAAVRGCPSPRQTGATIDRYLHLADTIVAAIQMRNSAAAVGPLIVRQAVTRARDVDPGLVFPMDLRWPAAMLAVSALALAITTLPRGGGNDARPAVRATSASGAGATVADAGPGREGHQAPHAATNESATTPATPGNSASLREADTLDRDRETSATRAPSESPEHERGAPGRDAANAAGPGRAMASAGRASALADANGGGGAGSGAPRGAGSGGVRGGALLAARGGTPQNGPPLQVPPEQIERARRESEAALTRGDIPPELRSYVRDYFRAITR